MWKIKTWSLTLKHKNIHSDSLIFIKNMKDKWKVREEKAGNNFAIACKNEDRETERERNS